MGVMERTIDHYYKPLRWPSGPLVSEGTTRYSDLIDWGLNHTFIDPGATVLDVSCDGGRTIHELARTSAAGIIYGVGRSEDRIKSEMTNKKWIEVGRVEIWPGSKSSLPFCGNMFDLVTAVDPHYLWSNWGRDVKEIRRVLKPGGFLAIIGGAHKTQGEQTMGWVEQPHVAYHNVRELCRLFSTAGYADVKVFVNYGRGWICGVGEKADGL